MHTKLLEKFGYTQELKRSLGLWQLTAFGLNYMIPLSPAIFFGFILVSSGGSVALPLLIAGIAMLLTAMSYAVMVRHFPLAGSLYNFVGRAWHPAMGFIAGWILLLDYLLITTVTSMSASIYLQQLVPSCSYHVLLFIFIAFTGFVNLLGINVLASLGLIVLVLIELMVFIAFVIWSYAIKVKPIGAGVLLSSVPLHFTNFGTLIHASSLAVACYLGFDAISTLAEEAKYPTRDIPRAIFICLAIGAVTMILTGYLGVLAVPDWQMHANDPAWLATVLFHVAQMTGGHVFSWFYSIAFVISMMVFNIVGTAATARLLFGMGRDQMLNKKIFSAVNKRWQTPHWNVLLIMLISFVVGSFAQIATIANLVNYGALLGFGLLNLSVIRLYNRADSFVMASSWQIYLRYLILPLMAFIVVMWVFYGLDRFTHVVGTLWLLLGIVYFAATVRYKIGVCVSK